MSQLPAHKTKLVCTIGPASESPDVLRKMLEAGMNVARLNFSHGDFSWHKSIIGRLRAAARATGKQVAAMAGKTRLVVGIWNGHFVNIPMRQAVHDRERIDPGGSLWASILDDTGQPELV